MPLLRRFETELVPEWRKQCIDYKGLKKRAEALVGSETAGDLQEKEQQAFQEFFSREMEKISHLYTKQERKLCKFFCAMEGKVEMLLTSVEANRHDFLGEDGTPNPDAIFQDSSNKQVPVAMLAFMVHIDALRTFALLNTLAVLHIAQRHCSKLLCCLVLHRLYQEPFYHCFRLSTLVEEINRISKDFLEGSIGQGAAQGTSAGRCDEFSEDKNSQSEEQDYVSAYCTWVNHKGRVPPWVCKSLANKDILQGDRRNIRVTPLVQQFVGNLSRRLQARGLADMVPALVKQMSVSRGAAAPAASTRKPGAEQQQHQPTHAEQQSAAPAGPLPVRATPSRPFAPTLAPQKAPAVHRPADRESAFTFAGPIVPRAQAQGGVGSFVGGNGCVSVQVADAARRPANAADSAGGFVNGGATWSSGVGCRQHPGGAGVSQQAVSQGMRGGGGEERKEAVVGDGKGNRLTGLRLQRSCWNLQALTLCEEEGGEGAAKDLEGRGMLIPCGSDRYNISRHSESSSSMHSAASTRYSSPPAGASPPGSLKDYSLSS